MCGIAGIVEPGGVGPGDGERLDRMLRVQGHRGPDEGGTYFTKDAGLGHRRLSIIDLESGRQPIGNEAGDVVAVVNGEFYNFLELREGLLARGHRFRTTGDSECLVHLYEERGEDCIDLLAGMFAFGLWDERRRKLVLARDRLGVKPLYYGFDGRRVVFGSELKAIVAARGILPGIDAGAVLEYLTFGFVPSPGTIFEGVCKLGPGELVVFENGSLRRRRYWDLGFRGHMEMADEEMAEALWDRLRTATRSRLIADVPIGAFLSGGLDSTAVVAAMGESARGRVSTVTAGFEEAGFDERARAREVAAAIGAEHEEVMSRCDVGELLGKLAWHFDEPFADASAVPMWGMSEVARRRFKVMLSGDGGDEALAGYRRYRFDRYESAARGMMPRAMRRAVGAMGARWPGGAAVPRWLRAGATMRNIGVDAASGHAMSVATMGFGEARGLLCGDVERAVWGHDPLEHVRKAFLRCDAPDDLSRSQYADLFVMLADGILTKVDRASMAHGLEVRSPMLDYRFIEFAWRIPPGKRIRGRSGKAPLRRAVARRLGHEVANRRKRGFETPVDGWFRGALRGRLEGMLAEQGAQTWAWIDRGRARGLFEEHLSGRRDLGAALWRLVMFDEWLRMGPRYLGEDGGSVGGGAGVLRTNAKERVEHCTPVSFDI